MRKYRYTRARQNLNSLKLLDNPEFSDMSTA